MNFSDTIMGQRFFNKQLPDLIKAVNRLADAQEEQNKLIKQQIELNTENKENDKTT
jgi:hypothetical protein